MTNILVYNQEIKSFDLNLTFPKKLYEDLIKKINVDLLKMFRKFLEEKIL